MDGGRRVGPPLPDQAEVWRVVDRNRRHRQRWRLHRKRLHVLGARAAATGRELVPPPKAGEGDGNRWRRTLVEMVLRARERRRKGRKLWRANRRVVEADRRAAAAAPRGGGGESLCAATLRLVRGGRPVGAEESLRPGRQGGRAGRGVRRKRGEGVEPPGRD